MREIKFRGKRIDNGEWIYGSLIDMYSDSGQRFIFPWSNSASSMSCRQSVYSGIEAIIPETVGQCTDLKDTNGKEIYEGDRFRDPVAKAKERIYEVYWEDCGFPWFYGDGTGFDPSKIEVIGNIHETPH